MDHHLRNPYLALFRPQAPLHAKTAVALRLLEGGVNACSLQTSTQTSLENSPKSLCCPDTDVDALQLIDADADAL